MEEKRYCGDCDWYIPGGKDPNCANPTKLGNSRCTCPIKEACKAFVPREDRQKMEEDSGSINTHICSNMRKRRKRYK